jgi:hypothetical protein
MARSAVRRLADAAPASAIARDALEVIERVGIGPPYTIAVAGDPAARSELLNLLAGEQLFDPARSDPSRILLTLRRGPVTALRMRRRDGSVEQRKLAGTASAPLVTDAASLDLAIDVEVEQPPVRAIPRAMRASSVFTTEPATTLLVRRPPWWAVWRWPVYWWRAWRSRSRVRALLPPLAPALEVPAEGPAVLPAVSPDPAPTGTAAPSAPPPVLAAPRRALANTVERPRRTVDVLQPLVDALCSWLADDAVERLFVEVAAGPLPEQVVVIELPPRADPWSLASVAADACLVACGDEGFRMTGQLEAVLAIVPHLFAVGVRGLPLATAPRVRLLGDPGNAAAALIELAQIERQIAVGQRAVAALSAGCAILDRMTSSAESAFRARIDGLEALRIPDADHYTAAALARVRQTIVEHAHRLMQRALAELDGAIERFAADWMARLQGAASTDALRSAAARLDEESPAMLQRAQGEAHRALVEELTEHARAHYRELVSELRRGTTRTDAVPSWLTVEVRIGDMTSGTSLGQVAPRLSSLFRSLDALKTDALAQLEQRIAKLRQVASANLLDTEPRLEPAVTGTVAVALRADVERHGVWLEGELARERIEIDAERAQLTLLALTSDTARADERQITAAIASLSSELP